MSKGNVDTPPSMKDWRENLSLSPVGVKEVLMIKAWLRLAGVLDPTLGYNEQLKLIFEVVKDFCDFYFYPELISSPPFTKAPVDAIEAAI